MTRMCINQGGTAGYPVPSGIGCPAFFVGAGQCREEEYQGSAFKSRMRNRLKVKQEKKEMHSMKEKMYVSGKKIVLGLFMIMAVIVTIAVSSISAEAKTKDFAGGNGTKTKPYEVSTYAQLMNVSKYNGCYFKQTKDIDCDYRKIKNIFGKGSFYGCYDGNGYTIKNVLVTAQNAYLISSVDKSGTIKKVTFEDITINGKYKAALIGNNAGKLSNIKMKNCSVKTSLKKDGSIYAAAFCLTNGKNGVISSCKVSSTTVNATANSWYGDANGAGFCVTNKGQIKKSAISGLKLSVKSVQFTAQAGGFVLKNSGSMTSCKVTLNGTATCYGDKTGSYGAAEYGTMGRLAYTNTGVIRSCSTVGTFLADKKVKECYKNKGVIR